MSDPVVRIQHPIATRRLWPLALSQAMGGFNDNLLKNAIVVLALFKLGQGGVGLSALAGALLVLPYILLSATAGQVADRMPKHRLIVLLKGAEVALMLLALVGLVVGSIPALLAVLLGLGVQSALFGPAKYAILPETLHEHELVEGNSVLEGSTFMAIVLGTIVGGTVILMPQGEILVGALGFLLSLVGLWSACQIPATAAIAPDERVDANLFRAISSSIRSAFAVRGIRLSILGLSGFWTLGATLMTAFPVMVRDVLGAPGSVLTLFLVLFATGIGIGSALCTMLLKGEVTPRLVPFAAIGMALLTGDLALATSAAGAYAPHAGIADLLTSFHGVRILFDLTGIAVCGGLFSVPLYAIVQELSPKERRASIVAANNIVNAIAMVAGAALAAGLAAWGMSVTGVLLVFAALSLAGALYIVRILPQEVMRTLFRWYFDTFHGVDVKGLENYRAAGDRVVIVANHLSFADACLIACYLPDSPTFAVHTRTADFWWAKPFLAAVDIFRVDIQSPFSIKRMVEAVRDGGQKLMIFPEGRLTKTGSLMKVYEGAGVVADKSGAKVLPISIEGLQFTRLGRMKGKLPMRWFPRLSVTVMPPVDLRPEGAEEMLPRQRREAVGRALQDLLVDAVYHAKNTDRTLFSAVLDARETHGGGTLIAEDVNRSPISYDRLVLGAAVLGRKIAAAAKSNVTDAERATAQTAMARAASMSPEEIAVDSEVQSVLVTRGRPMEEVNLGLMLPNANGTLVAFLGLQAFGLVPCMLNFSAGADGMLSACRAARVRTVVSSRAFVEKGKLGKTVESMEGQVRFVWLEDLRASIVLADKIRGKLDAAFPRRLPGAKASPDAWAAVLFTSGSEGTPKGVVHSHRSLLSNCAQLSSVIDFNGSDRVFNAMPVFHSFGLTGGTILPLVYGVRTFHYPSPLHYRIVPSLIYDTDATVAFGTDTFLNGWAKYAHPYDFYAMRYIFAGAEKVKEETKRLYAERFGVRVLEAYGATETAPALSANTAMHSRSGTVGRFLPGVRHRLEPVPGVSTGGRLHVSGPNVMLGYLRAEKPGVLEAPMGGWYDTGDIVSVDNERFIQIHARAKRFAKIAGEMVSMTAAESLATSTWPTDQHAVVNVPDPRKGEALLLVTTRKGADPKEILLLARSRGTPEIMVPRAVLEVASMPLLGTGKVDYPAVQRRVDASRADGAAEALPEETEEVA